MLPNPTFLVYLLSHQDPSIGLFFLDIHSITSISKAVPFWVAQTIGRIQQQDLIKTAVNRHNHIGYANPELPFRIEKQDNFFDVVHYDAEGKRELGKRYFNEYVLLAD